MPTSTSYRHALLLVAAAACWGTGTVLSKQALDRGVQPLTLLVIELAASSMLLLVALIALRQRLIWSPTMTRLAALGLLNPGLAYTLGLLGLASISASMSVLMWATEPALIMVLAVIVLRERVTPATVIALTVALVGVLLVIYSPGASGDAAGIALTASAVAACGGYTVLTRRLLLDDSSVSVVFVQQVTALTFALILVVTTTVTGITDLGLPSDPATWGLAATSGSVYYGLAFWFFVSGLRGVPASIGAVFLPLIPVFGLAAGFVVGDRLTDRQWIGETLVIAATTVAVLWHLRRPHMCDESAR